MSHRILAEAYHDITTNPGDVLIVRSTFQGHEHIHEREYVRHTVTKKATYNKVMIIEFENELGLKSGVAGVFGND